MDTSEIHLARPPNSGLARVGGGSGFGVYGGLLLEGLVARECVIGGGRAELAQSSWLKMRVFSKRGRAIPSLG